MKHVLATFCVSGLCAGLMLAQDAPAGPASARGASRNDGVQSWTGLLVASACQDDGGLAAGTTAGMAQATPGANREHSTTYEQQMNQADRSEVAGSAADPSATPAARSRDAASADRWTKAQEAARQLDKSCRIGAATGAFALRLSGGRMVRFDEASNAKIVEELKSAGRLKNGAGIFRVIVKGSERADRIALESIQL